MLNENSLSPCTWTETCDLSNSSRNEWSKYFTLLELETGEVKKDSSLMGENESKGYERAFVLFDVGMDAVNNTFINTSSSTS